MKTMRLEPTGLGILLMLLIGMLAAPAVAQDAPPILVNLEGAVRIALDPGGNTRVAVALESVEQAEAQSRAERADLLPNFSGYVIEQNATSNLEARGIDFAIPGGFMFPRLIGPYNTFDARANVTTLLLDWGAVERYRASEASVAAAESLSAGARNEVAAATATAYTVALGAEARVRAAEANVAEAESLLELAENQLDAGTGTAIEVTRARVELSSQRQNLLSAGNESRRARLELLRAMNLRLDTPIVLEADLGALPATGIELPTLIQTALERRPDLEAGRQGEDRAEKLYDSVRAERWPALRGYADYGSLGSAPNHSVPTRTFGVDLRVPIFDGGRRQAREADARSELAAERLRIEELEQDVELEVRLAVDAMETAGAQMEVAGEGLGLAEEELQRAERRYRAGITSNIEVVDAQARLERAREDEILARTRLQVARIELGRATATIEETILGP